MHFTDPDQFQILVNSLVVGPPVDFPQVFREDIEFARYRTLLQ